MQTKTILLITAAILFCSNQNILAQCGMMMNMNDDKQEMKTMQQDTAAIQDSTKIIYTCSMHPEIISDKPGFCPKCGMELVNAGKEKTQSEQKQHQMDMMMMCPMHGMVDMNHKHDEPKKDNMKMMKGMGIAMGAMMVVMMGVMIVIVAAR